ncbi:peptide-methionine (S)-S-oxide reductase MsrA [Mariniplasma anaerobium]|uniref:Peptide methionine sulfoxide reductase MsrA n=1 Tax=Mariniplasma anaerobium TaxID=2735436 RepID=A0A7U9XVC4_9MOLU|nr:peptide-methionine (S)-S-oxide reductase MsrA [Mariniplasma anaerobium]BCR35980.1 peptide methionine sulfoxide reductase MsrA [Mariniplasma anaerobium]
MKSIVLAGGCFWGVEAYFDQLKGISETSVGYVDGDKKNPTYHEVCNGLASHAEACKVIYDENVISLEGVLEHFFRIMNPFSLNKQGNDYGNQYRSGIYLDDMSEKPLVEAYMKSYFGKNYDRVVVKVKENKDYALAEDNHQKYLKKNPFGYCHVNLGLAKRDEKK